jgi:hypothetical protein
MPSVIDASGLEDMHRAALVLSSKKSNSRNNDKASQQTGS